MREDVRKEVNSDSLPCPAAAAAAAAPAHDGEHRQCSGSTGD